MPSNICVVKEYSIFVPMYHPFKYEASKPHEEKEVDMLVENIHPFSLVVWNDEVNTFEWVIETLIEICGHNEQQAEQCAMLIHTKGKYAVKLGDYDTLKPMCDAITDRGIGATIEELAVGH